MNHEILFDIICANQCQVIAIMSASYEAVKQKAELEVLKLKAGEGSLSTLSDRIDMTAHATRHAGMHAGRHTYRQ
eukprot:COSAG06_NODE_16557_length_994_cov_1.134078_2_plen_74_part_01